MPIVKWSVFCVDKFFGSFLKWYKMNYEYFFMKSNGTKFEQEIERIHLEVKADLHFDQELYRSCKMDLDKHCSNVFRGNSRCLLIFSLRN